MALFNFGKKKEKTKAPACDCNGGGEAMDAECTEIVSDCCGSALKGICCVKVLGSGCKNCHALYEAAVQAVRNRGLSVEVEYVTDMEKVMEYGVMSMPALVVNEKIVSMGRVLTVTQIEKLLEKY